MNFQVMTDDRDEGDAQCLLSTELISCDKRCEIWAQYDRGGQTAAREPHAAL
jgi:hypothetical protein